MPNANDLALKLYCGHAYETGRATTLRALRKMNCSFDVSLDSLTKDDPPEYYVDLVTYLVIQSYLTDSKILVKVLEERYREVLFFYLGSGPVSVKLIANGWLRLIGILHRIDDILIGADYSYSCIPVERIYKTEVFKTVIDMYVVKDGKVSMYNFIPKNNLPALTERYTNVKINMCLEYLDEAGLYPDYCSMVQFKTVKRFISSGLSLSMGTVSTEKFDYQRAMKGYRNSYLATETSTSNCRVCVAIEECNPFKLWNELDR